MSETARPMATTKAAAPAGVARAETAACREESALGV